MQRHRARVPARDATLRGPVARPVALRWDTWGLPHIRAETFRDVYVGLGYAMAQERLWQLDYMRRLVRGELAAILGPETLSSDRAMRTLGLRRTAEADLRDVRGDVAEALDGLAAGINAWTEQVRRLPLEFDLLGYRPTPWRAEDSIAIWKYRWWLLTGRLEGIYIAEVARRLLPPALYAPFMAVEVPEETIVPDVARNRATGAASDEGSNNWVAGPSRTITGKPVLCSDPHNPFGAPSQWFEAQLTGPGVDVIGAIYQGTPGVYLGRNRHVAWGVTNHMIPARDLYVEEVNPANQDEYRAAGTWRRFEVLDEAIEVAGASAERIKIRQTVRGPLVDGTGLLDVPREPGLEPPRLSLRWVGHDPGTGFESFLDLNRATSAAQVLDALAHWPCPPLNFVYADTQGEFGYHVAGRVPRRQAATRGYRTAEDAAHGWDGDMPFDALPREHAPPRGWVATANNPPWAGHDPHYVALGAWSDGYRFRRIRRRLEAAGKLSTADVAAIHADVRSARAEEVVPPLLRLLEPHATRQARAALRHLSAWDYQFTVDAVGASVFASFWDAWRAEIARARFPGSLVPLATGECGALGRHLLLDGDDVGWFTSGSVAEHARHAFAAALERLSALAGSRPSGWRWGRLHTVTFHHPLGQQRTGLSTGPAPTSGGAVVRAAGHDPTGPFHALSGSTYRLVVDFADPGKARSVSTLGQSGHPTSRHYRDQTALWLADAYKPLWMDEADVLANLEGTTVLTP